jgi:hypothetical protein
MAKIFANSFSCHELAELWRVIQVCQSACALALSKAQINAEGSAVLLESMALIERREKVLMGNQEKFLS